jgi:GNAT superfamily N-acetyltransferase
MRIRGANLTPIRRMVGKAGSRANKDIGNREAPPRKMFVAAAWRGPAHGVAQALIDTAIASARGNRVREIILGTTAKFLAAHRFYEKNGFIEIGAGELPPAFPRMKVDTKFYRLDLTASAAA